jgi:type I restriction-modification system DNA methylase subunit
MNMAIRGIDADIRQGDTLQDDKLRDLKFDYILANPPKRNLKNTRKKCNFAKW